MVKSCFFLLTHFITWTLYFHWHNAFCTDGCDKSGEFYFSVSRKLPNEDDSALTKWIKSRRKFHTSHLTWRFILKIVSDTKMVFLLNMTHVVHEIVEMFFCMYLHYNAVKNLVHRQWYLILSSFGLKKKKRVLFTCNSAGQIWGQL